ncbi:MAG: hypothetical protein JSV03_09500, partial [Planctomycetota bacterium]
MAVMNVVQIKSFRLIYVILPVWLLLSDVLGAGIKDVSTTRVYIDCSQKLQKIDGFGSSAFGGFTVFEKGHCDAEFAKGITYKTT